jgi:AhpD family alkylhydroperoxidase
MTSTYGRALQEELVPQTRALRRAIPDVYRGFSALHDCALVAGALDTRTKELIALAIAVSKECDGCIAAHAHAAARHGASAQEVAEAIGVTFLMDGGPATVYGPRAYSAFLEFVEQERGPSALPGRQQRHLASE